MGIDLGGEVEEPFLEPPDSSGEEEAGIAGFPFRQTIGVGQESLDLFFGSCEVGGRMIGAGFVDVASQVDETFLMDAVHLVVGAEEISDDNAMERVAQERLGDFAAAAVGDLGVGPEFVGDGPEPTVFPVDLPAGFVDVLDGGLLQGGQDDIGLHAQPERQSLKGLGDGALGHGQAHKVFEQSDDLVSGHDDVIFEPDHRGQGLRPQIGVRDFIRGRGRGDQSLASGAPVPVMDEASDFHPGGNNVLLDMIVLPRGGVQGVMALRASGQLLDDLAIDVIGSGARASAMAGLLTPPMGRESSAVGSF